MDYNMLYNIPSMVLLSCSIVTQVDYINKSIYDPRLIRSEWFWKMAIILIGVSLDIPDIFVY